MSEDPIISAISILYSNSSNKLHASNYLENIKLSETGYLECISRLNNIINNCINKNKIMSENNVIFWYILVLQYISNKRWDSISYENKNLIRCTIINFIKNVCPLDQIENYIRNGIAVLILKIALNDFPNYWPSLFHDLIELFPLDDEIVNRELDRTPAELLRCTQFKDAMRDTVLNEMISSLFYVLNNFPKLIEKTLFTIAPFISWMDIGLIQNNEYIPFLFNCLGTNNALPAATCILELINKRMDVNKKLLQFNTLSIISILSPQVDFILRNEIIRIDDKDNYADLIAQICNSVGSHMITIIKTATLNDIERQSCLTMLTQIAELNFRLFSNKEYFIALEIIPFISQYSELLQLDSLKPDAPSLLPTILNLCAIQMTYREGYNFDNKDDDEEDFDSFRSSVANIVRNASKFFPEITITFVFNYCTSIMSQLNSLPFSTIESALFMYYLLAEGVPNYNSLIQTNAPFSEIMKLLLSSPLASYPSKVVLLQYIELLARYSKFFDSNFNFLPNVISSLLNDHGLLHPSSLIRNRVCHIFLRLVRSLHSSARKNLGTLSNDIVAYLQSIVFRVLEPDCMTDPYITISSAQMLAETIGVLISPSVLGQDSIHAMSKVLFCYTEEIRKEKEKIFTPSNDANLSAKKIADLIEFTGNSIKCCSFDASLLQTVVEIYAASTNVILQAFTACSPHPDVRSKTIFYLHQMIEPLPSNVLLPILHPVISQLLQQSKSDNITPVMELINQTVIKFKNDSVIFLRAIFLDCVNRQFECFKEFDYIAKLIEEKQPESVYLTEKKFCISLNKMYFSFLNGIISQNCGIIFCMDEVAPFISDILLPVSVGCLNPPETSVNKMCFSIIFQILKIYNEKILNFPKFQQFFLDRVVLSIIELPSLNHFSVDNFACAVTLQENCEMLVFLAKIFQNSFIQTVGSLMIKANIDMTVAQNFCLILQTLDSKNLFDFFKSYISSLKLKK